MTEVKRTIIVAMLVASFGFGALAQHSGLGFLAPMLVLVVLVVAWAEAELDA